MIHFLKSEQPYYDELVINRPQFPGNLIGRTVEIRKNDRGYKEGDYIVLMEYDKYKNQYSGTQVYRKVTHVSAYRQEEGYVALSLFVTDQSYPASILLQEELEKIRRFQ